jgi:hypothetical protein
MKVLAGELAMIVLPSAVIDAERAMLVVFELLTKLPIKV